MLPEIVPGRKQFAASQGSMLLRNKTQPDVPRATRLITHVYELGVLGFGLSINGKIGVGIFPNSQKFFVGFSGGCVITHQSLCPAELKPRQWAGYKFPAQTWIVDQLLELGRRRSAIA